jgi:hypothetical protein
MIDHIAIWASRHNISFAEFSAMVAVWSGDCDYWNGQAMTRLYAEAIGEKSPMIRKADFRI